MINIFRLRTPQTEEDWQLTLKVPSYGRRIAITKLRGLLNQITYGPVWSGQPAELRDLNDLDRTVYWNAAEELAPIFEKALPDTFKQLGWNVKLPSNAVSFQYILLTITLGFRELFATQSAPRTKRLWPDGTNREQWIANIQKRGSEFRPLVELIEYWGKELQVLAPTLLIHGSCATLDHVSGSSDLDTLLIIGKNTLCDPGLLAAFVFKCVESQQYLLKFNPYMHHGHMLVSELELGELCEANLPICLIENGVTFGSCPDLSLYYDMDMEAAISFNMFEELFEKKLVKTSDIKSAFDLLWWESSAIFVVILFIQLKDRQCRWKPDAIEAARQHLSAEENALIDFLTKLRREMGALLPPLPSSSRDADMGTQNPGLLLRKQKEITQLTVSQLSDLGVNDQTLKEVLAMYRRLSSEVSNMFFERYVESSNLLRSCAGAFAGKVISEVPAPIDLSMYELTKDWIVNRLQTIEEVKAVYQYGEVGCPGLSDLDVLIVMKDDALKPVPFQLNDMPEQLQDVMGHDATFVGEKSLTLFPKVFPLFGARLLYGDGQKNIAASFSELQSVLPAYTITFLAKYPADLIYLCRLNTVRFKTILAFLHSFKHFIPLFTLLGSEIPPAVNKAIERDELVRRDFSLNKMPLVAELPEIMEIMFYATAAVARAIDDGWSKLIPSLPAIDSAFKINNPDIEFSSAWTEDVMLAHCQAKLSNSNVSHVPLPASFGWFVCWLSLGSGLVSKYLMNTQGADFQSTVTNSAEKLYGFEVVNSFREDINFFAETEHAMRRHVSKYVVFVDIPAGADIPAAPRIADKGHALSGPVGSSDVLVTSIIWLRTDSIGDAVLASAMLPHIHGKYGKASITVFCQEHIAELYESSPFVQKIISFDRQRALIDQNYREHLLAKLQSVHADICINSVYSRELLTDYFAVGCGARERVAFIGDLANISAADRDACNQHYTMLVPSSGEWMHEFGRYADYLAAFGIISAKLEPQCWTTTDDSVFADEFFSKNKLIPEKTIALFPKAQYDIKLYDKYGESLAEICRAEGFNIIGLGGKSDHSCVQEHLDYINVASFNLSGHISLRQSAEIIRRCRLVVGADTALAHIACAVGTRNVVLMGGGHFGRFMPYSPLTSLVCLPLECYQCNWRCRFNRNYCIKDISPVVLAEAIKTTLNVPSKFSRIFLQAQDSWVKNTEVPRWDSSNIASDMAQSKCIIVDPNATGKSRYSNTLEVSSLVRHDDHFEESHVTTHRTQVKVSAIVSTFNSSSFIEGCLDDLISQTLFERGELEIVVIDSGSEENEGDAVARYQKRHPNISYIKTEREPLYAAWNRGISLATGKYITNANTDDRHDTDALATLAAALDAREDIDLVYGDCFVSTVPNETFAENAKTDCYRYPDYFAPAALLHFQFGIHPMWRRTVHEKIGHFDESFKAAGDFDFNIRFALAGLRALHVDRVIGLYLKHEKAISFRDTTMSLEGKKIADVFQTEENIVLLYRTEGVIGSAPEQLARVLVDMGVRALGYYPPWKNGGPEQNLELARRCFRMAHEKMPDWLAPGNNLAVVYYLAGNVELALQILFTFGSTPAEIIRLNIDVIQSTSLLAPHLASSGLIRPDQKTLAGIGQGGSPAESPALHGRSDKPFTVTLVASVGKIDPIECCGGLETAMRETARALAARGHRVALVGNLMASPGFYDGVEYLSLDLWKGGVYPEFSSATDVLAFASGPDLESYSYVEPHVARVALFHHQELKFLVAAAPDRILKENADAVICVSQAVRNNLTRDNIPADKLYVVPNGYDPRVFYPRQVIRSPHRVVFVGALVPAKNPLFLIQSFLRILPHVPDAELHICGAASLWGAQDYFSQDDVRALSDQVIFHGILSGAELALQYSLATICVIPSKVESFSLVSLEAQACGCIPLVANVGGVTETIVPGKTGFVYEPDEPDALALLLYRLLQSSSQMHGVSTDAISFVTKTFSWDKTADQYEDIFIKTRHDKDFNRKAKKWNSIIDAEIQPIKYDEIQYVNKSILNASKAEVINWLRIGNLIELIECNDGLHKKGLEFFFSAKILDLKKEDIIMDAAGGRSNYLEAVKKNIGSHNLYLTDHIYKGVKKLDNDIFIVGGDITYINLSSNSLSKIACHHAFEHFQENKDVAFIKEAYRLLQDDGILVIIPMFLTSRYVECWNIDTDKHFDEFSHVIIDRTASIPGADEDGHFARFYSSSAFISRIIKPADELGFKCEIIECHVDGEEIPDMVANFGSTLNRPLRALKLIKIPSGKSELS